MGSLTPSTLPDKSSPLLHLLHPTTSEKIATWTLNSANWGTALPLTAYLERESYLTTIPLASHGGITHWILVSDSDLPSSRRVLASCESLRKRALVAHAGTLREVITHGVGSVFCNPEYRGKGYAGRMLNELGPLLKEWQTTEERDCVFSFLYSDIGKKFYAGLGWRPFPSTHVTFLPSPSTSTSSSSPTPNPGNGNGNAKRLQAGDIAPLCAQDEATLRKQLPAASLADGKTHIALIPDHDQMQWHHLREDFMTSKLFGRSPSTKGAIAGPAGSRVWAIWTRSFYGPVEEEKSGNTLHILRLVVENESVESQGSNVEALKAILQIAREEAKEWKVLGVELWNPTNYVQALVEGTGLEHSRVEREEESIASLMWYGQGEGEGEQVEWVGNEKYGWC